MKNFNHSKKIVLGGLMALALLPLMSAFVSRAQPAADRPAVIQIADGSETHGSKPPKGA